MSAVGYDSVPWDLGALLAVKQLAADAGPEGVKHPVRVSGLVGATAGGFSGGTLASLLGALDDPASRGMSGAHALVPGWSGPNPAPQMSARFCAPARRWTLPSIMAAVNEKVVARSAALAPDTYGPGFAYSEATIAPNAIGAFIGTALMGVGALALALPPSRWLLNKTLLPQPGQGPSEAAREGGRFSAHHVAEDASVPPRRAYARLAVRGADPGYKGTSIMAAEAALCLALQRDELPGRAGGCLTPATCFGEVLAARLRKHGFDIAARAMAPDETVPDA